MGVGRRGVPCVEDGSDVVRGMAGDARCAAVGRRAGDGDTGGVFPLPSLGNLSLCMFGFAFVRAWDDMAFDRFSRLAIDAPWLGQDLFLTVMILTFAILFVMARRVAPLYERPWAMGMAALLPIASTLVLFVTLDLAIVPQGSAVWVLLTVLSLICAGMGAAISILLWAELQSCFNSLRLMLYVSGAFFLGALLGWLLVGLDGGRLLFATMALPLLSVMCLRRGFVQIPAQDLPKHTWGRTRFPWLLVVVLGIYQFVFGVTHGGHVASVSPAVWGTLFASGSLFVATCLFSHALDLTRIYRTPFVLMTCGLLITLLSFSASGAIGSLFVSTAYSFMFLVLTVLLCDISHRYGISVLVLCGIQEIATVTIMVGDVVRDAMSRGVIPVEPNSPTVIVFLTILVIIATVALLYSGHESREWSLTFFGADDALEGATERDRTAAKCAEVGERFGLSPREREVLQLVALGRPSAQISRELCIADGTLKSHMQRIYQKMGVHSRTEVLALLDAFGGDGRHGGE